MYALCLKVAGKWEVRIGSGIFLEEQEILTDLAILAWSESNNQDRGLHINASKEN